MKMAMGWGGEGATGSSYVNPLPHINLNFATWRTYDKETEVEEVFSLKHEINIYRYSKWLIYIIKYKQLEKEIRKEKQF